MKKLKINNLKALLIFTLSIIFIYIYHSIMLLLSLKAINIPEFLVSFLITLTIIKPFLYLPVAYFGYKVLKYLLGLYKILKENKIPYHKLNN